MMACPHPKCEYNRGSHWSVLLRDLTRTHTCAVHLSPVISECATHHQCRVPKIKLLWIFYLGRTEGFSSGKNTYSMDEFAFPAQRPSASTTIQVLTESKPQTWDPPHRKGNLTRISGSVQHKGCIRKAVRVSCSDLPPREPPLRGIFRNSLSCHPFGIHHSIHT